MSFKDNFPRTALPGEVVPTLDIFGEPICEDEAGLTLALLLVIFVDAIGLPRIWEMVLEDDARRIVEVDGLVAELALEIADTKPIAVTTFNDEDLNFSNAP